MSDIDHTILGFHCEREDWPKLIAAARELLEQDPEDYYSHYYSIFAYAAQRNFRKANEHLKILLSLGPDAESTFLAAIQLKLNEGRWRQARDFARNGLSFHPDSALLYYYDAAIAIRKLKTKHAKQQITRAKQLDPNDPDIADLYLRIHGIDTDNPKKAVERIQNYKLALARDPENAALHYGIGDVYMDDLRQANEAAYHYREAVRLSPADSSYRKSLFHAVAMQDLLYGLFSLPSRATSFLGYVIKGIMLQPWRLIFLLVGFKFVGVFFVWLALAYIAFWPTSKIYEYLLVSEIKNADRISDQRLRSWFYFQRKPTCIRFLLLLLLVFATYAAFFASIGIPIKPGFAFLGIFSAMHFLFILISRLYRNYRYKSAKRQVGQYA